MILTSKHQILQDIPIAECTIDHLKQTSIKSLVNNKVLQNPDLHWHNHCVCIQCGAKATGWFRVTYTPSKGSPEHTSGFYFKSNKGRYVMLTFDHIWPRALGGAQGSSNGQIMCYTCNNNKSSKTTETLAYQVIQNTRRFISTYPQYRCKYIQFVKQKFPHLHVDIHPVSHVKLNVIEDSLIEDSLIYDY